MKYVRLDIEIPERLKREMRAEAKRQFKTMTAFVRQAIIEKIARDKNPEA
jgi:hypothetical protein